MSIVQDTPAHAIEQLRDRGFQVNVRHLREIHYIHKLPLMTAFQARLAIMPQTHLRPAMFTSRGGRTEVDIVRDGEVIAFGWANCSALDNYSKKAGLRVALGRALKEFHE